MKNKKTVESQVWKKLRQIDRRKNKTFNGFEIETADYNHPLSGLRTLRRMRERGKVNYSVVNRHKSLYELKWLVD